MTIFHSLEVSKGALFKLSFKKSRFKPLINAQEHQKYGLMLFLDLV